ncbi:MAG: hypothetical protein KGN84_09505 [Acidobacteriota bacterium]|nr:hypothetical protein [Acidobacteriota bacterium]
MPIVSPFHPKQPEKPGPLGPIHGSKTPPPPPANFTAGSFPPVVHDAPVEQTVLGITMTADANLTASLTAGEPVFRVVNIAVDDQNPVQLKPSDLPPSLQGEAGDWVWEDTPAAAGGGVTPVAAKKGQRVYLNVACDVASGGALPGPLSGTVVLNGGASFSSTVVLSGTYVGVNPNSPIGKKWASMGGEAFFGAAKTNEQPAPDGRGTIQEFAHGVLYEYWQSSRIELRSPRVYYFSPAIWAKWLSLKDAKDAYNSPLWQVLVYPSGDTVATAEHGQAMPFDTGIIVARPGGQSYVVYGAIHAHYKSFGDPVTGAAPVMGYPTSDELPANAGWRVSHFDTGDIYWSAAAGPHEMHGAIHTHWLANQYLGYPLTDQTTAADGAGQFNLFQEGAIYQQAAGAPAF